MSTTQTYAVTGMTCDHCARAVRAEVGDVDGVTGVDVDVAAGRVTVTSRAPARLSARRPPSPGAGNPLPA